MMNYKNYRYYFNDRSREKVSLHYQKWFQKTAIRVLITFLVYVRKPLANMYAPLKRKYIRGNNSPFINRILSKETMKRTRLRNKFFKSKSQDDKKNYVKQSYCVSLFRRTKKEQPLWKLLNPSNKSIVNEKIILAEKETVRRNDSSVANVLNNLFSNIV